MEQPGTNSKLPLYTLTSLYFFWGFVAASNTVLIPLFKSNFQLSQFQSQLVDMAFYAAYFFGSLVYFLFSILKEDLLNRIGYKNGLVYGLIVSAVGALGFVPAASYQSFPMMLSSLFIVGLGFALLQIVANPYVIALGNPATGAHRVNLAGGINSLGTTIGPLLIGYALFGSINGADTAHTGVAAVKMPYMILAVALVVFAIILGLSKLPAVKNEAHLEKSIGALRYPQLVMGMVAIFAYVGVEVAIQSNLPALMQLPEINGLEPKYTLHFISLYWGSLMIGRWMAAVTVFDLGKSARLLWRIAAPLLAYGLIILVNYIKGSPVNDFIAYFPYILILIALYFVGQEKPARTLVLFSLAGMVMMLVGLFSTGSMALYAFISGGLFCSVMWPCIFSLSIAGLGKYTNQGSALLIMMILGGAIIPPLQGLIGDHYGMHISYVVPVFCFAYLAYYAWKVTAVLKTQGIDYETGA